MAIEVAQQNSSHLVLIIGTGFSGIGLAVQLKQAGIDDFVLLEKAHSVGGCWRDNSYPGAACDVPSHLYSFSFEPKFDWSRKFAPQAEIYGYLRYCAQKYRVLPHVRFGTEVTRASFDCQRNQWRVETGKGEILWARVLVSACGQLSRPAYPKLPGLEHFTGKQFHSARWDHSYDLRHRRVAVIGTGASAIQFVPEIAARVASLTLFQRSAPYVIAKPDRLYPPWEQRLLSRVPLLHRLNRTRLYFQHEARALAFNQFRWAMKLFKLNWQRHIRSIIKDRVLRQKLTPDYPLGCKRILISNTYYQSLNQSHVEVVSDTIREVTPTGIVTEKGREFPVDAIIFGTGFQATDFLVPMQISGREGQDLHQVWHDGAEAYLGMTVAGFPNFFMMYGPNTNLGHNSIVFMLENQMRYIVQAIQSLQVEPAKAFDLKPEVQQVFNRYIQQAVRHTVWDQGCTSWYKTESGKNTNNWPGFTLTYRYLTRRFDLRQYDILVDTERS